MSLPVPAAALPDEGAVVGFNYASLDEAKAQEARTVAERIKGRMKAGIIETGRDLISIKERIGHGAFGAWIEAEFRMDERTAQNYMRAAAVFGDHSEIVSVLPAATVYTLAAKSTPEAIRADVLRQIEEGQRPEPGVIAKTIRTAKQQERERKEAAAKEAKLAKLTDEQRADLERKAKRSVQSRAQRQAQQEREAANRRAEDEQREQAAREAAALVVECLGDELGRFMELREAFNPWDLSRAFDTLTKPTFNLPLSRIMPYGKYEG